jgi:hypothetical protein
MRPYGVNTQTGKSALNPGVEADEMARTAKEAHGKVCLLALLNPHENLSESCCPEECSAWSWNSGGEANEDRIGHCVLAGEAADSRPGIRKAS